MVSQPTLSKRMPDKAPGSDGFAATWFGRHVYCLSYLLK